MGREPWGAVAESSHGRIDEMKREEKLAEKLTLVLNSATITQLRVRVSPIQLFFHTSDPSAAEAWSSWLARDLSEV